MYRLEVELNGSADVGGTDLLMHSDNIVWADQMEAWAKNADNKTESKAGDDRSPPWRWLGNVYHDGTVVGIPADNLMTMLREAGAMKILKGQTTYKKLSQSSILINEQIWPIEANGRPVLWDDITGLIDEGQFSKHIDLVRSLGYDLLVKRARVKSAKHIRVRPRFRNWTARGSLTVLDDKKLPIEVVREFFDLGGAYCGLCDWRPSSKQSPGVFGKFAATVTQV